jgi:hypothetical protein
MSDQLQRQFEQKSSGRRDSP